MLEVKEAREGVCDGEGGNSIGVKTRLTSWRKESRRKAGSRGRGSESLTNIEVVLGLPAVPQAVDERVADLTLQSNS